MLLACGLLLVTLRQLWASCGQLRAVAGKGGVLYGKMLCAHGRHVGICEHCWHASAWDTGSEQAAAEKRDLRDAKAAR